MMHVDSLRGILTQEQRADPCGSEQPHRLPPLASLGIALPHTHTRAHTFTHTQYTHTHTRTHKLHINLCTAHPPFSALPYVAVRCQHTHNGCVGGQFKGLASQCVSGCYRAISIALATAIELQAKRHGGGESKPE